MADPRDEEIRRLSQSLGAAFQMIATLAATLKRQGLGSRVTLDLSVATPLILDERSRKMWEEAHRQLAQVPEPPQPD